MNAINAKYSWYEMLCNVAIWHLRLFTVPLEMLLHVDVGERYLGVSGLLSLLALGAGAIIQGSPLLFVLLIGAIVRIAMHRFLCIRHRQAGLAMPSSRSPGRPALGILFDALPEWVIQWGEPAVVIFGGLILGLISDPLSSYILWAGGAMLCAKVVRASVAYNRTLDVLDAQVESSPHLLSTRRVEVFEPLDASVNGNARLLGA